MILHVGDMKSFEEKLNRNLPPNVICVGYSGRIRFFKTKEERSRWIWERDHPILAFFAKLWRGKL